MAASGRRSSVQSLSLQMKRHRLSTNNQCIHFDCYTLVITVKTAAQNITGHVTGEDKDWLFLFYIICLWFAQMYYTHTHTNTQQGEFWSTKVICSANKTTESSLLFPECGEECVKDGR